MGYIERAFEELEVMTDKMKHEPEKTLNGQELDTPETAIVIDASRQELQTIEAKRTNASDGSASQRHDPSILEAQSGTIELFDDKSGMTASRKNPANEADFRSEKLAMSPHQLEPVYPEPEKPVVDDRIPVIAMLGMDTEISRACMKSPTLKSLVERMNDLSWDLYVVFTSDSRSYEYDPVKSTISLNSRLSGTTQIETFGHELYHGTHQPLNELYADCLPISKEEYKQIRMDGEAGAFLTEHKINRELNHSHAVGYDYVKGLGAARMLIGELIHYNSNGEIDDKKSKAAIGQFLRLHPAAVIQNGSVVRDAKGLPLNQSYDKNHDEEYSGYLEHFGTNRKALLSKGILKD